MRRQGGNRRTGICSHQGREPSTSQLRNFLATDTTHPNRATSQIDYFRFAYALIDRIAEARRSGVDVRLGEIESWP